VWTRRQAALGRPTLPQGTDLTAWSSEQFLFFSDPSGQPLSKTSAGDYAAMTVFDYDYSPGSGEGQVPAPGPAVAASPATRQRADHLCNDRYKMQANSGLYASGAGRVHPVIVGWSTRNRPLLPRPINDTP
jgi:hypothetical protein